VVVRLRPVHRPDGRHGSPPDRA